MSFRPNRQGPRPALESVYTGAGELAPRSRRFVPLRLHSTEQSIIDMHRGEGGADLETWRDAWAFAATAREVTGRPIPEHLARIMQAVRAHYVRAARVVVSAWSDRGAAALVRRMLDEENRRLDPAREAAARQSLAMPTRSRRDRTGERVDGEPQTLWEIAGSAASGGGGPPAAAAFSPTHHNIQGPKDLTGAAGASQCAGEGPRAGENAGAPASESTTGYEARGGLDADRRTSDDTVADDAGPTNEGT